MIPDYAFEFYFPASARGAALDGLVRLCTDDTRAAVERAGRQPGEAAADIVLSLPPDPALLKWRADHAEMHTGAAAGEVRVGFIALWVKPESDDRICVRLWPVTRAMQVACLDSPTVRRALVDLLATHHGVVGYLDRGDGSLVEMWPNDAA